MRILVTGRRSFIGQWARLTAVADGHYTIALDRNEVAFG